MTGPQYYRNRRSNERFVGFECTGCGWVSFPEKRTLCKRCGAAPAQFEETQLRKQGHIQTFVVQQYSPEGFESPQPIAVVDLPQAGGGDPARVFGLLTESDPDAIEIGTQVRARFREMFRDGDRPIHSFKFMVVEDDNE